MKKVQSINALLYIALAAIMVSAVFSFSPFALFGTLVLVSLLMPKNVAFMALQVEVWKDDIVKNLWKNNDFATRCVIADSFVLAGKVVHIPVAGAPTATKKNLTVFPQTAVNRADSELTYVLDTIYALPRQIQDIEKYENSYNKRQSVVGEDEQKLIQDAMDSLLFRWAPGVANVIATTGAASGFDLIDDTATGTRKLFTKDEFKKVIKKMRNKNVVGRITAELTVNHYYQFFESLSDAEKTDVGRVADLANGVVGKYMGAEILMRSTVLRYRKVAGVWTVIDTQAEDFAAGTGDSAASLFYVDSCVERALGEIKVFDDNGNPLYYGDVFSAYLRIGGRIRRTEGVYAVVEDFVS